MAQASSTTTISLPSAADCPVGTRIPELRQEIDLLTLVRYAGASTDFNQIHFNEEFAKAAGLPGIIGHGLLGMGLVSEAVTNWLGDSGLLKDLSVRFVNSFFLGDVLTVTGEITEKATTDEGQTQLELRLSCVNQDNVEIIGNAVATVLLPGERSNNG